MKLLIKSSNALKNLAGRDGSRFAVAGGGGGARRSKYGEGESAASDRGRGTVIFFTVFGFSSVRTEDMTVEMGGREMEIVGESRWFPPEMKGEEMASIVNGGPRT